MATIVKESEALAAKVVADAKALMARFNLKQSDAMQLAILAQIRDALQASTQVGPQAVTEVTRAGRIIITPVSNQIVGYKNHFFTSLPFTSTASAFIDLPSICQIVIAEPTVAAYIEFDTQPNTSPNGTPVIQPLQGLASPLQAKRVYVQGQSGSGTLYLWAFW